ncbi:hypothetical protein ADIMK_2336 [Marinobacterium lacunae]|uniref:Uncharacterized protein n=1 Tax=Marinobacterium lacunae TaxID=1232683 RepID=A0A081FYF2_9GAMM|nr:hypothetical protein [Marinobacterium lacunae]KEA63557.1 hypothetical protein ADIMK_2336 [Marinobacterium lacunae]
MNIPSALQFVLAAIAIVLLVTALVIPPSKWIEYFKSKTGLGVLKGIVLALLFGAALAFGPKLFAAESGMFFKDASVYLGLDHLKDVSPQCEQGGVDDRWTSNLGVRMNIYQSADERFRTNAKYTHHSCMLGEDSEGYDAFGVELEYKFWQR